MKWRIEFDECLLEEMVITPDIISYFENIDFDSLTLNEDFTFDYEFCIDDFYFPDYLVNVREKVVLFVGVVSV